MTTALNNFQLNAQKAVEDTLAKQEIATTRTIGLDADQRPLITFEFNKDGRHEIEIFAEDLVMTRGERLFESYMSEEFIDDEAHIEGFSQRLDRYLSGGSWEGPNEAGRLGQWLSKFLPGLRRKC